MLIKKLQNNESTRSLHENGEIHVPLFRASDIFCNGCKILISKRGAESRSLTKELSFENEDVISA